MKGLDVARHAASSSPGRAAVPSGSRVVILVSRGPAPSAPVGYANVPDVINLQQGDALARLQKAGLEPRVFNDYSERVRRERVISQYPEPGGRLPRGATQVLMVSSGPAEPSAFVPLPDVVGRPEAEALEVLQRAQLSAQVVHEYSPSVPAGIVLGQLPDPGALIAEEERRGPAPWLWIAIGAALLLLAGLLFLLFGRQVTVPDVTGMTAEQAETRLASVGLESGSVTATESAEVAQGTVVGQNPAAGERVRRGSEVGLIVVGGVPDVQVPDVLGLSKAEAVAALEDAGLAVATTDAPSSSVDRGDVIRQTPSGGQTVPQGTTVGIVVSEGERVENVAVPDVTGMSRAEAEAALREAGLRFVVAENPNPDVPDGTVASQLPAAGDSVAQGTTVGIEVSTGAPADTARVSVPDVEGMTLAEAQNALRNADLESTPVAVVGSDRPQNEVVAQTPTAGDSVAPGTTVVIFYSSGT